MAIVIKSPWELERMAETGRLHTEIFAELEPLIRPGVTTLELEQFVARAIKERGGVAPQMGYQGTYPFATCMSLNEVVVHGFPGKRPLKEGDVLKVDFAFTYQGFTTDMARTYAIGKVSPEAEKLIRVTEEAFWAGLEVMKAGNRTGDVAATVQQYVEGHGFWVVREMVGHGVGRSMHEDPQVPNFGKAGQGPKLRPGMTLAFEPMVTQFPAKVVILEDGWTASAGKGNLAAHYENTVAITEAGPRLLTGSPRSVAAR
ncbi:type I methionyl aminopeptidase [Calidithermus chliarophilus]|uniref:type I methionyl aminopeptidase n=1 Tax=Calidithermus chliarophilus TaxID=52023 RepID=UPI0003F95DAC|nr:type I methionyl aminopeptidase [Calidithermus chliarophilus]